MAVFLLSGFISVYAAEPLAKTPPAPHHLKQPPKLWNLQNADILSIIDEVSAETGKNFIVDPRVSGKISLTSSKPIKPTEVYDLFLSILELLGYSAIPSGDVVKIVPNVESSELATQVATADTPAKGAEVVVRVIPLENVNATQLIPTIRPMLPQWSNVSAYMPGNTLILLGRAANLERIIAVIHDIDKASSNDIDLIPLHQASAAQVATVLSNLQNAARMTGDTPQVSISADERSNSLLLSGNKAARLRMRALISQLDAPASGEQGNTQVIYLRYLQAKTFAPILGKIAQNILEKENISKSSGPILLNASAGNKSSASSQNQTLIQAELSTNALIVTAPPGLMLALQNIIAKLDIRPAQVLVEAIIVEINQDDLKEFGIQWGALTTATSISDTNTNDGFSPLGLGKIGIIPGVPFKAVLSVLQNKTGVNILSTPSIVVLDNQKASLSVGKQVPEQTGSYASTSSTATVTPFNTVGYKDVVLKLDVIPQINLGNAVRLTITLKNDTLQNPDDPGLTPITNTSEIKNSVIINSDDTLVIGGLISNNINESTNKVPLLGDLPLIGNVFTHKSRKLEKKNLMVFIKPVILHTMDDATVITNTKYQLIRHAQINWPENLSQSGKQKLENILPLWKNNVDLPKPFES